MAARQAKKSKRTQDRRMRWYREARFGMFIHWGIYAIPEGIWKGTEIEGLGEWIMNRARIPVREYEKLAGQFNPVKFNAREWVQLAKRAGMKYLTITSKHHDGFALFKSEASPYNIVDASPYGKDVIAALATSDEKRFRFSYLGRIVAAGLRDAKDVKAKMGDELKNLATVSAAMDRSVADEVKAQRRWLTILATVASSAPFVGLLGTVFGIINSFKGMQANESAGIAAVAGGIAEALYMTGFGLVVAIPAVWLYNWANASVESIGVEMTNSSSEMHDWVKKNWKAL